MKVTPNNFCSYCPGTVDFIEHFFFLCPIVNDFWKSIELFILEKIGIHIHLTVINVLFGTQDRTVFRDKEQEKYVNHILIIGKMCISIFKKTKSNALLYNVFEKHFSLREHLN